MGECNSVKPDKRKSFSTKTCAVGTQNKTSAAGTQNIRLMDKKIITIFNNVKKSVNKSVLNTVKLSYNNLLNMPKKGIIIIWKFVKTICTDHDQNIVNAKNKWALTRENLSSGTTKAQTSLHIRTV